MGNTQASYLSNNSSFVNKYVDKTVLQNNNIGDILVQIGSNSLVLGAWTNLLANGTTSSYIGFNAEL